MSKQSVQNVKESINLTLIFKSVGISYIITLPLFAVFAIVLSSTSYPESLISPAVIVTTIISLLFAGYATTAGLKSKGWMNGAIVGFLYMFVLYVAGSVILGTFEITRYVMTMFAMGILCGALGGIMGINFSGRKRY